MSTRFASPDVSVRIITSRRRSWRPYMTSMYGLQKNGSGAFDAAWPPKGDCQDSASAGSGSRTYMNFKSTSRLSSGPLRAERATRSLLCRRWERWGRT